MAGKYDDECDALLRRRDAELAVVAIAGGDRGNGFSISLDLSKCICPACMLKAVADVLREIATDVESSAAAKAAHTHGGPVQ